MIGEGSWKEECIAELNQAAQARVVGNEGMARVCARRAAGIVVREYYRRRREEPPEKSAYNLLLAFSLDQEQSEEMRTVANNFTLAITHDHVLPVKVDLIRSVNLLANSLLEDEVAPAG